MQQSLARCIELESIGQGRMRVRLESDIRPAPGQFVLLGPPHNDVLRRTVFPCQQLKDGFEFELLPGDPLRPLLAPGVALDLIGPLGRGLPETTARRILLVANLEPAALLPFTGRGGSEVTLLLGRPYPVKALSPEIEVRVGHLPTLIKDYVKWAEQTFVYTIPDRDTQLVRAFRTAGFDLAQVHLLLTPGMPCGVGACQACGVVTGKGIHWACVDGPLFTLAVLAN